MPAGLISFVIPAGAPLSSHSHTWSSGSPAATCHACNNFARIGVLQDGVVTGSVCGAFVSVWMRLRIAVTASMGGVGVDEPNRPQAASIHDELLALFLDASCCAVRRAFILLPSCSPNLLTEDSLETDRVASRSPPTAACSARTFSSVGGSPLQSCEKVIFSSIFGDSAEE